MHIIKFFGVFFVSIDQISIIMLFVGIFGLFLWGKLRHDVVALMGLIGASLLGVIPGEELFSGFGHPATLTVMFVLILSYGLTKSGAIEGVVHFVSPLSDRPSLHVAALVFIAAFFSMFMNSVGALALLMPVATQATLKAGRSPSSILMPLSFGSILGGMGTLIGTPPNIIIAKYRAESVGEAFQMFDFMPVGGLVAIVGIVFMALIGWRLVKERSPNNSANLFEIDSYLFEVKVLKNSKLLKRTLRSLDEEFNDFDITLAALIHKKQYYPVPPQRHIVGVGDLFVLEGSQDSIDRFVSKFHLALLSADSVRNAISHSVNTTMIEVVIAPGSHIDGKSVDQVHFRSNYGINLLAISREGKPLRGRLKAFLLKAGDVLLFHGELSHIDGVIGKLGCFPLATKGGELGKRRHSTPALVIFFGAIVCAVIGLASLPVCLGAAVVLMVVFQVVPPRDLYKGVDWAVVVLLGAMIPLGGALEATGVTGLLVNSLMQFMGGAPLWGVIGAFLIITMTLSDILNNAATAILMAPVAKSVAISLSANIDPFLMAVAIGASCAFLTPIGHQNNALVMGPGGYRFSDYWRIGLPLEAIIVLVATPLILLFWPA